MPPAPNSSSRLPFWVRGAGSTGARIVALLLIVGAVGAVVGFGLGYPISRIKVSGDTAVSLDQPALVGTFDPQAALVTAADLPKNWAPTDTAFEAYSLIGAPVCGQTAKVGNQQGTRLVAVFRDEAAQSFLLSEVIRVSQPGDAQTYLNDVEDAFQGCSSFYRIAGGTKTKVNIGPGQQNPPISDFASYTLRPPKSGITQRMVIMQIGDVIVSLQFAGPTLPQQTLLANAEHAILVRTAPKQFSQKQKVPGEKNLPPLPTSTTTSTTTTTLPPTTLAPTTTTRARRRITTTTHAAAPPATAPPAAPTPTTPG
jgi:hypothetical protein